MAEYRDEGKSARTDDLAKWPAFASMLADPEAHRFDVIVVHKLDRFARNILVTLQTLDRLHQANVAFVSISEQMDFSTPMGKVFLATLAAFAQYYSENLSSETKEGKHERKRQGMYNGLIPFGLKKGADGLPVPDPETYPGLLLAFKAAAAGKTDRDIAVLLNEAGCRTTGNRGPNPFHKDTVRRTLLNWFYLGELPDEDGGWLPGKHQAALDPALFAAAQAGREAKRRAKPCASGPGGAKTYALSGLAVCGNCGGKMHIYANRQGRARIYCYQGRQAAPCPQPSLFLDLIEQQLTDYLAAFQVPTDYREQIMAIYRQAEKEQDSGETRRRQIEARLHRIKELYRWGDIERGDYQRERDSLMTELAGLEHATDQTVMQAKAAEFLADLPAAWAAATPEQRNRLARLVFQWVEIKDDWAVAITPQPEFAAFFLMHCQQEAESNNVRKRRDSLSQLHSATWCHRRRRRSTTAPSRPLATHRLPTTSRPPLRSGRSSGDPMQQASSHAAGTGR